MNLSFNDINAYLVVNGQWGITPFGVYDAPPMLFRSASLSVSPPNDAVSTVAGSKSYRKNSKPSITLNGEVALTPATFNSILNSTGSYGYAGGYAAQLNIGGYTLNDICLSSLSISLEPYKMVTANVTFDVHRGISKDIVSFIGQTGSHALLTGGEGYDYDNGETTGVLPWIPVDVDNCSLLYTPQSVLAQIDDVFIDGKDIYQIDYTVNCSRIPRHTIGNEYPTSTVLTSVESNMQLGYKNFKEVQFYKKATDLEPTTGSTVIDLHDISGNYGGSIEIKGQAVNLSSNFSKDAAGTLSFAQKLL